MRAQWDDLVFRPPSKGTLPTGSSQHLCLGLGPLGTCGSQEFTQASTPRNLAHPGRHHVTLRWVRTVCRTVPGTSRLHPSSFLMQPLSHVTFLAPAPLTINPSTCRDPTLSSCLLIHHSSRSFSISLFQGHQSLKSANFMGIKLFYGMGVTCHHGHWNNRKTSEGGRP